MEAVINLGGKMQQGETGKGSDLREGPCIPMAVSSGPCALALSPVEGMRSVVGHAWATCSSSGRSPAWSSQAFAHALQLPSPRTGVRPSTGSRAAAVGKWVFSSLSTLTAGTVINNCSSYRDEQL